MDGKQQASEPWNLDCLPQQAEIEFCAQCQAVTFHLPKLSGQQLCIVCLHFEYYSFYSGTMSNESD